MDRIVTYGEQSLWRSDHLDFSKSIDKVYTFDERTIKRMSKDNAMYYYKAKLNVVWAMQMQDKRLLKIALRDFRRIRRVLWEK